MQLQAWSSGTDPGISAPETVLLTSIYTASKNATNTGDQYMFGVDDTVTWRGGEQRRRAGLKLSRSVLDCQ